MSWMASAHNDCKESKVNQWKAYATGLVVVALMVPATAAHAEKVWVEEDINGVDCEMETWFEVWDGLYHHYPALGYEIESYCGHQATVDWGSSADLVLIEPVNAPARPAAPPVATAPVQPAPVVAPVEPAPATQPAPTLPEPEQVTPGHGFTPLMRAV